MRAASRYSCQTRTASLPPLKTSPSASGRSCAPGKRPSVHHEEPIEGGNRKVIAAARATIQEISFCRNSAGLTSG